MGKKNNTKFIQYIYLAYKQITDWLVNKRDYHSQERDYTRIGTFTTRVRRNSAEFEEFRWDSAVFDVFFTGFVDFKPLFNYG